MDRRLTPANGRVAAMHLQGCVDSAQFVDGVVRRVISPLADLNRSPDGPRDRQLLFGEAVTMFDELDGHAFVQALRDGYVGYVATSALGDVPVPTHWVTVPATHAYMEPDLKSADRQSLSFGSQIAVTAEMQSFFETADGLYVPKPHLWPVSKRFSDPVTVAQLHFGVPYLWGGNSIWGIDCSGLVQASLLAVGRECPGDSDMQMAEVGTELDSDASLQRGDLVFWKSHLATMVDETTMIHANAHRMAVSYEPYEAAVKRIAAQGEGPVLLRRRP